MTSQVAQTILDFLDQNASIPDTRTLGLDAAAVRAALTSLVDKQMVLMESHAQEEAVLSAEGEEVTEKGSPEWRLWQVLATGPQTAKQLQSTLGPDTAKVGQLNAFKKKWIKKDGDGFAQALSDVPDQVRSDLQALKNGQPLPSTVASEYRKRKLTAIKRTAYQSVSKGPKFSTKIAKLETDLTAEMLQSGAWKTAEFKPFNFDAEGMPPAAGALHPLLKVREEFRNIFFEMGFSEMPTNQFVESCFWNFDALFVPQQHPARELQDTFYVKDPASTDDFPEDYLAKVRKVHESGGYGSIGYRSPWKQSDTERLVLRTHTTAISANMLYKLANQPGGFKPTKLFSIDRVFRNEAVDATHLAEFHQVEGVVADYNLTLGDLIGFMDVFFAKMGVKNLRFKPAFNPYTEPSLEIFSYHAGLGKWVEIGNSGMFRPEMLEPMGLPKDVRALGWGLSLERPTMIKYGISNIRDLVGHKVPIEMVEKSAAVRF
ncbi:uncharacterized protein L969DRAFT_87559 [Mixia osmundae IAM 14324]|uniref:phenylalanine--tRNA ligase n=1 Tax=Mixia osmundae (strain CBS 9802 / IAM 14324 / JCM 22182 / KY 12970) TaxID=764103 RepID=G7DVV8_MIXOS|nr:uncharacterized protein L969DRAFT_87559 [Mixia osmundae IAM 14324]KEI39603.1 hypothetical protein L969DRAFT_87559 [Mixia osmundae IAM 14324]GAA94718.1 hypothetical protein E5Q_01371 [Mixia osmundae IAM 14324]